MLFRQVLSMNPYDSKKNEPKKWQEISDALNEAGLDVTPRSCRERTKFCLTKWKAEERIKKNATGTSEIVGERDNLLQELSDLIREAEGKET
jgi:Myb/SANT-like DNA-binding domain